MFNDKIQSTNGLFPKALRMEEMFFLGVQSRDRKGATIAPLRSRL